MEEKCVNTQHLSTACKQFSGVRPTLDSHRSSQHVRRTPTKSVLPKYCYVPKSATLDIAFGVAAYRLHNAFPIVELHGGTNVIIPL